MKLPVQVEAVVFKRINGATQFLALHRVPSRGGFWQPVTGGLEDTDASMELAVSREIKEELSIDPLDQLAIFSLEYSFIFRDEKDIDLVEHTFGVEISPNAEPKISDEHDTLIWGSASVIKGLMKYHENIIAIEKTEERILNGI